MDQATTFQAEPKVFAPRTTRQLIAYQQVEDFEAQYLNPLIGQDPAETCSNIATVMEHVYRCMRDGKDADENRDVITLMVQVAMTAAQYEQMVANQMKGNHEK